MSWRRAHRLSPAFRGGWQVEAVAVQHLAEKIRLLAAPQMDQTGALERPGRGRLASIP